MQIKLTVKGGGTLYGFDYNDIALGLYELSLAPSESLEDWMCSTAKRIETQFGYIVRYDNTDNFVFDLIMCGLLTEVKD